MSVYTVHEPARQNRPQQAADRILFVKEGFCWPALFVPVLWLLYHRMWLTFIVYLAISIALAAAGEWLGAGELGGALAAGLFGLLFAFEANELRHRSLAWRGYRFAGTVAGADLDECERRFFALWLERGGPARQNPARQNPPQQAAPGAPGMAQQPYRVIGSFPAPGLR